MKLTDPNDHDDEDDFYDDDLEDEDDLYDDCGMTSEGLCMYAGSEWCDWSCPLQKLRDQSAARTSLTSDRAET